MTLRPVAAALFFLAAVPVCAGIAAAAASLGDRLLGDSVPHECGKRGLVVGLMGIWAAVLFGFLAGQVDWIADRIAGPDSPPPEPSKPAAGIGFVSRPGANASSVNSTTNP